MDGGQKKCGGIERGENCAVAVAPWRLHTHKGKEVKGCECRCADCLSKSSVSLSKSIDLFSKSINLFSKSIHLLCKPIPNQLIGTLVLPPSTLEPERIAGDLHRFSGVVALRDSADPRKATVLKSTDEGVEEGSEIRVACLADLALP